jgi:TorA maturation chaperone TorD
MLFVNNIPHILAPPYEAFYVESQDVLGSLNRWYMKKDYINVKERADHIVAELQFVALLSQENQQKTAYAFIEEHLYQWIVPFTERIIRYANTEYFCLMGKLAAHLIERIRRKELL